VSIERNRELRRRRHRAKKLANWSRKLKNGTVSEKAEIASKLRRLTPGCDVIINQWGLTELDR
jgi:hypothetical protein